MHEIISHIILIEILVRPSFNPCDIHFYSGGKGIVNYPSGFKTLQFGPDKCRSFTGFNMLKLYNCIKVIVVLND